MCLTAQALLRSGGEVDRFRRELRRGLRWWFAAGPPGIGLATAKACVRIWLGFRDPGVWSAGNGPAMRAAILGVCTRSDQMAELVCAETILTHTDTQAVDGSAVVAWWTGYQSAGEPWASAEDLRRMADQIAEDGRPGPIARHLHTAAEALEAGKTVAEFASDIGLSAGVTGYIAHTVPMAVYAFLRHPDDYRTAVESVIRLGGDTDTVAAITGALVGARVGKAGIPREWLERWIDWPRSVAHIEELGRRLAQGKWRTEPQPAVPLAWWGIWCEGVCRRTDRRFMEPGA